ncbi:MAG TPA: hypothetical protein QGF58_24100 [Myxococcota bacterium]|nr:hypothetical protein [Myxococcota bacterium]
MTGCDLTEREIRRRGFEVLEKPILPSALSALTRRWDDACGVVRLHRAPELRACVG